VVVNPVNVEVVVGVLDVSIGVGLGLGAGVGLGAGTGVGLGDGVIVAFPDGFEDKVVVASAGPLDERV
jgi:hypothetical protein